MAVERAGYDQQTAPRSAGGPVLTSPQAMGAGIGEGMAQLGDTLHRSELRAYEIERKRIANEELADWSHRFGTHRQQMADVVLNGRTNAGPGAAGHAQRMREANQAAREAALGGITDPEVRRHAERQWDEYEEGIYTREATYEDGQRVLKLVTDTQKGIDAGANLVRRGATPESYGDELKRQLDTIELLQVDEGTKEKLRRESETALGVAFIQHLQDTDPAKAQAAIDSGAFDHLGPDVVERLRNGTAVEMRRKQAEIEQEAAGQRAAIREQLATIEEAHRQGLAIDDAQYDLAIQAADKLGDASLALKLKGMRDDNGFARVYSGQSPLQREQRMAELAARKDKLGEKEQRELNWLREKRGSLNERFDGDTAGWAIENAPPSLKPPTGDITQPDVLRERIAWSKRASEAYGRPVAPLTRAEADQLRAIKDSGGEQDVLEVLDRTGDEAARVQIARQVAPDDELFQRMAVLQAPARRVARNGQQVLKANTAFLKASDENPEVNEVLAEKEGQLRQALRFAGAEDQEAVVTMARFVLAGLMSGAGGTADQIKEGNIQDAVHIAMGGTIDRRNGARYGGIMSWGDRPVALPSKKNARGFGDAIRADMMARKEWPVEPDEAGSPANLGRAYPVLMGVDPRNPNVLLYQWRDMTGRVLQSSKGGDFVSRIEDRR